MSHRTSVLERYRNEDYAAKEDLEQPMIRAEELASIKGCTLRRAQQIIAESPYKVKIHSSKPGYPAWGIPVQVLLNVIEQDKKDREALGRT